MIRGTIVGATMFICFEVDWVLVTETELRGVIGVVRDDSPYACQRRAFA